jgi:hypothetical protein
MTDGIIDINNIRRVRAMKTLRAKQVIAETTASMLDDPFLKKLYEQEAQDLALARAVLLDVGGITPDVRNAAAIVDMSLGQMDTASDSVTMARALRRALDYWPKLSKLFDVEVRGG